MMGDIWRDELLQYCVYDPAHKDHLKTQTWIDDLAGEFSEPQRYAQVAARAMALINAAPLAAE